MKKEWLKPELMDLQVKETMEDSAQYSGCESENGNEKFPWLHKHICSKCKKDFGHGIGSHLQWMHHQSTCTGNSGDIPPLS